MHIGPNHPFRQSRHSSSSSNATYSVNADGRRARKENQFIERHGSKLHAYDRDKAPYPCSFDRHVLELQCLDNAIIVATKDSPSFLDLPVPPKRCLDIGTGLGLWVVSAAKAWPDTTFAGVDMVNIQIPLSTLDPDIADRIEWAHCNILRNKLPFDDDEFDHVHIQGLASGIPEIKWYDIYEEVRRVMKPGGTIEHSEEDALFPILPRWYTDPLRAHARTLSTAAPGSVQQRLSYPPCTDRNHLSHEHEMLEMLYDDVWSNRFINPTPSSIIPGYFGAIFDRVQAPPVVNMLPPPLAPFAPLPGIRNPPARPSFAASTSSDAPDTSPLVGDGQSPQEGIPEPPQSADEPAIDPHPQNTSLASPSSSPTLLASTDNSPKSVSPLPSSPPDPKKAIEDMSGIPSDADSASLAPSSKRSRSRSQSSSSTSYQSAETSYRAFTAPHPSGVQLEDDGTTLNDGNAIEMLGIERARSRDEHARYMQLFRAVAGVLSTKEAMWDELLDRVNRHDPILEKYGWQEEDYDEQASRERFEHAVEQYQSDMRTRVSLWNCAVMHGWTMPRRDPPSRAELLEEMQLRHEILEAQRFASTQEEEQPCRRVRVVFGVKAK